MKVTWRCFEWLTSLGKSHHHQRGSQAVGSRKQGHRTEWTRSGDPAGDDQEETGRLARWPRQRCGGWIEIGRIRIKAKSRCYPI